MRIALRAVSGYLTAEAGGEPEPGRGLVSANRSQIGAWETWTVERPPHFDATRIALKSCNGYYLCAEGGGGDAVYANRAEAHGWEGFQAIPTLQGGQIIILQTENGRSLSVSAVGEHIVDAVGLASTFIVEVVEADSVPPAKDRLPRLIAISGHRMIADTGEHVFGRGASAFLLFKKHLDGEDIGPQLDQLRALDCNLIRVMGMFESLGGFNPKNYGDRYYDQIAPFCRRCEAAGIYVLWTACAATGGMMTPDEALRHTQRTAAQLVTTRNPLFSYVNEQGQHNNSVDRARFKREVNTEWMLYDTGSFGMDQPCEPPFGTHVVLHVNRRYPNSVKDSCILDHPNYVTDHLQVGLDEPDRYGTTQDDRGNGNTQQAADAAGTAYTALFWVFHSLEGERGNVLTGNTLDCAKAAFAAMAGH